MTSFVLPVFLHNLVGLGKVHVTLSFFCSQSICHAHGVPCTASFTMRLLGMLECQWFPLQPTAPASPWTVQAPLKCRNPFPSTQCVCSNARKSNLANFFNTEIFLLWDIFQGQVFLKLTCPDHAISLMHQGLNSVFMPLCFLQCPWLWGFFLCVLCVCVFVLVWFGLIVWFGLFVGARGSPLRRRAPRLAVLGEDNPSTPPLCPADNFFSCLSVLSLLVSLP